MNRIAIGVSSAALLALAGSVSAQQVGSFFDVFFPPDNFASGPAYPTGLASVHVLNGSPGALHLDANLGMGLGSMRLNGLPPGTPVTGTLRALPGDQGAGGFPVNSFFDVFCDISGSPPGPAPNSFFDVFADWSDIGSPGVIRHALPMAAPYFVDSFFDIFVEVDLPSPGGMTQSLHLHGQMAPGAHINPGSHVDFPANSFFDVFFDISYDASFNPNSPTMRMTLSGSVPAPGGAAALLGLGMVAGLRRRR